MIPLCRKQTELGGLVRDRRGNTLEFIRAICRPEVLHGAASQIDPDALGRRAEAALCSGPS
jgi:hypothetical protein